MGKFIQYTKEIYNDYCSGFITYIELLNQALFYVKSNFNDLFNDLPEEMLNILIDYQIISNNDIFFNKTKWMKFLGVYFMHPDLNWINIKNDLQEEFKIRYFKDQKFNVIKQFETDFCIDFKAPFSAGWLMILEPGTVLISHRDIYFNEENIFLIPQEYFEFEKKYVDIEYITTPFYNGFGFSIKIKDFLKYCKVID